jgi:hypothetical protein
VGGRCQLRTKYCSTVPCYIASEFSRPRLVFRRQSLAIRTSGTTGQLVQAMAAFGGGNAGESFNAAAFGADASQQQFFTAPQHA